MTIHTPWVYFVSVAGREVVAAEIRKMKLSSSELDHLANILQRISTGQSMPGDTDYLGRELWEVRARLYKRILRLIYFIHYEPSLYVVVFAGIKKTQKTPPGWIALALARKNAWQAIDE